MSFRLNVVRLTVAVPTVKETKLNQSHKILNIPQFTSIKTVRTHRQGGGLLSCIKNNISFSKLNTSNTFPIKLQVIKFTFLHHNNYISQTCSFHLAITNKEGSIISSTFTTITNLPSTIITADVNAHSPLWYSLTKNHKELIKDILLNSNHITQNTNNPTRLPLNQT